MYAHVNDEFELYIPLQLLADTIGMKPQCYLYTVLSGFVRQDVILAQMRCIKMCTDEMPAVRQYLLTILWKWVDDFSFVVCSIDKFTYKMFHCKRMKGIQSNVVE